MTNGKQPWRCQPRHRPPHEHEANGNATRRIHCSWDVALTYDAENHLVTISGDDAATDVYDADGKRVKASFGHAPNVTIEVYVGALVIPTPPALSAAQRNPHPR